MTAPVDPYRIWRLVVFVLTVAVAAAAVIGYYFFAIGNDFWGRWLLNGWWVW